ncbi:hypothetical protein P3800_22235, partial [Pseudomonas aeruginosa]|nr:hypothetical protein [Pseudomonas aeruginosa]
MKLLALLMCMTPGLVFAGSNDCYRIKDKDSESYCLAVTSGNSSKCYSIKNKDAEKLCLAEVRGSASSCYSIRDKDTKETPNKSA